MLYREIIAVCSEIHTKHINTLCGQNVEVLDVKSSGTYSEHGALIVKTPTVTKNEMALVCEEAVQTVVRHATSRAPPPNETLRRLQSTVTVLTFRRLMSYIYIYIYIYMEHPFLMFLDHTQRRSTVGRTPLDE